MTELSIYQSIKKWIQLYGVNILDLLLKVENDKSNDPLIRYANGDISVFAEMVNGHVSLESYYREQVGMKYPYLGIKIDELSNSDSCFPVYLITFISEFSTVSPKAEQLCIKNEPESILEYYDKLECALYDMMQNLYRDLDAVRDKLKFAPADIHVELYNVEPIQTSNEIFTRRFPFRVDGFACG